MRDISLEALAIIATGAAYRTQVWVTLPGDDPVEVLHSPGWSVSEKGTTSGTRLSISGLTLLPTDGIDDLFAFAGTPGAVYDVSVGVVVGAEVQYLPVFHGRAIEGSSSRNRLGVTISLSDDWQWFDDVPFNAPLDYGIETRASLISAIVTQVMPALTVVTTSDGSTTCVSGVYTNSRGQAVQQFADDGLLSVGFNAAGDFIIKARPDLDVTLTPDWTFKAGSAALLTTGPGPYSPAFGSGTFGSGPFGGSGYVGSTSIGPLPNIVAGTLERTRPWAESLINSVKVVPGGDWQTWTAQTANLADEDDPRHEGNVGLRQIEVTSNTIGNAYDAYRLAQAVLTRKLRITDERVKLTVALNPAVEADDIAYIAAPPSLDDAGWNGTYIITSVTHAPSAGTTSIEAVSASAYELGT